MDEEQQSWQRQPGEPLNWHKRFTRLRLMDSVRSINAVYAQEFGTKNDEKERPKAPGKWYEIAKQWKWEERAGAWDAHLDAQLEQAIAAEEKKVLRQEYALKHKRVAELNRIVTKLIGYLEDESHVWLPDVKAIGTGEFAERVDLVRFNAPLFSEIRAHFDDIAKEKGERVKKSQMAVSFPPDVYEGIGPDDDGSVM